MTLIHLVRHGEHNMAGRALPGRTPGVGLSQRGQAEIAIIAERLAGEGVTALYSSPLQRTRESAEIIAARLDLPINIHDELIELDFGDWTGATYESIRADPRWQRWSTQRCIATIPGGESMRAVQRRAVDALLDIAERHPDDTIAAISHGDVIRSALLYVLGMPLDLYNRIEIALASVTTLRLDNTGIRFLAMSQRPLVD
ncbi:MAG TPA: histidine phosphatase family protein [Stellaceae bacterium]|jgi:probable phosphoglycerate mutase|nr:histidine phosphatase family protein [Stellaceae bacterium]